MSYIEERDEKYKEKIKTEILPNLPAFCGSFLTGIAMKTTVLTRYNYGTDLRVFFGYLCGPDGLFDKLPQEVTLDDMERITADALELYIVFLEGYIGAKEGKKRKNGRAGQARNFCAVRALFRYLYNRDLLSKNVALKVSVPTVPEKEIVRMGAKEVKKMMTSLDTGDNLASKRQYNYNMHNTSVRDNAIITLLLCTGIRVSECVGLNVEDIDFKNRSFTVTRKGGKRAVLYYNGEVEDALDFYLDFRTKRIIEKFGEETTLAPLFLSTRLTRISVRAVEILVKKYASSAAPHKKITPHKLRSTYGTELYRKTKDIYVVAEVLGHNDINTTKKHYAEMSEEIKREAGTKITFRKKKPTDED